MLVSWTNTSRGTARSLLTLESGGDLFVSIRVLQNAFSHVLNLVSYFGFSFVPPALILLGRKQDALVFLFGSVRDATVPCHLLYAHQDLVFHSVLCFFLLLSSSVPDGDIKLLQ